MSEIIYIELICWHHDAPLAGYFEIDKIRELVAWKYYGPTLYCDVEVYVKDCDIYLASKVVKHKPYKNQQSLPVPMHWWKDFSRDFITSLPVSSTWKGKIYDLILFMVNSLTKMAYYEPVKITIDIAGLA